MTKELIAENLGRVLSFYKSDFGAGSLVYDISAKGMLDIYANVLDCNGAPARNLSRLYLNDQVWDEFKLDICSLRISDYSERYGIGISLLYSGYYWEILNEDGIKREKEEYHKNCTKNNQ